MTDREQRVATLFDELWPRELGYVPRSGLDGPIIRLVAGLTRTVCRLVVRVEDLEARLPPANCPGSEMFLPDHPDPFVACPVCGVETLVLHYADRSGHILTHPVKP